MTATEHDAHVKTYRFWCMANNMYPHTWLVGANPHRYGWVYKAFTHDSGASDLSGGYKLYPERITK
jgi:hypothetical protein